MKREIKLEEANESISSLVKDLQSYSQIIFTESNEPVASLKPLKSKDAKNKNLVIVTYILRSLALLCAFASFISFLIVFFDNTKGGPGPVMGGAIIFLVFGFGAVGLSGIFALVDVICCIVLFKKGEDSFLRFVWKIYLPMILILSGTMAIAFSN